MKKYLYILHIALAVTFLSLAIRAFVTPDDIMDTVKDSTLFGPIFGSIPVQLIGIHDIAMSILLALRIFPKYVSAWATLWLSAVILLLLTHMTPDGAIDALEHAAPFGIALFLTVTYFKKAK